MPIPYRLTFPLNAMQHPGLWGISPHFYGLYPCRGQVAYVLLTSAPVADRRIATPSLPLDLHVLSLSLAFILSQDQTLRCCLSFFLFFSDKKHRPLSPDRWLLLDGGFRPLCLSCLTVALFQCPLCSSEQSLHCLAGRPRFGVASAKVQQIKLPTKLFYNFFVLNFHAFIQSIETQQNSITIFFQTNFETTV